MAASRPLLALAEGLVDYAGLFPPARLALEPALANFAQYGRGPDRWLLARFILPATRLAELGAAHLAPFDAGQPLRLSLLGSAQGQGAAIAAFAAQHAATSRAEALETRLPEDDAGIAPFLAAEQVALAATGLPLRPFYELPWDAAWEGRLPRAVAELAEHNARHGTGVGFKLRCGGEQPETIPSPRQVARALSLCRAAGLPMKFTAGLHHALRHWDATVGATMHGFFNVFLAGLLAHDQALDEEALLPLLQEQEVAAFHIGAEALGWRELRVSAPAIERLRATMLISYGSCSFEEPRDELHALGPLPG